MGASRCGITSQLVSMDELAVVGILGTLVTSALSTPAPEPPMTEACRFVGRLDRGCPEASSGRVRDHGAAAVSDNSPDPKLPKMDATRGHTAPRTRRGRSRPRILTGGGGQGEAQAVTSGLLSFTPLIKRDEWITSSSACRRSSSRTSKNHGKRQACERFLAGWSSFTRRG